MSERDPTNPFQDRSEIQHMTEKVQVFVCSNPKCGAVHVKDPQGHCPICITQQGVGFSTMRRALIQDRIGVITSNLALRQADRLETALRNMMAAYERRIRSDCASAEDLAKEPWRCAEYTAAEATLKAADGEP